MNAQPSVPTSLPETNFSDRIKLLIQRIGSVTQIARMCGFSEGVVRSWRDGNTDPSRARCVTLARTLGISLMWLVAGEGSILADPIVATSDDQHSAQTFSAHALPTHVAQRASHTASIVGSGVDMQRLNTAMRLLQSELELTNSNMNLAENTDMLTELYEIVGPAGTQADATAIVEFNHRLARRIQHTEPTV
ncbi:MAG TPA: helix-turn-helix transcriptional regulator [Rhodanobacter sp.]|nr:helix-turn-helix transcriptional regulator [Rhodanobacter sp.]